jgi:hypothetical protein
MMRIAAITLRPNRTPRPNLARDRSIALTMLRLRSGSCQLFSIVRAHISLSAASRFYGARLPKV